MKTLAILATTALLATSGAAFAQKPVPMTDAQMDKVTAGALINVAIVDVVDVRNVQVAIPVNASVAIAVLGGALATALQLPGLVRQ